MTTVPDASAVLAVVRVTGASIATMGGPFAEETLSATDAHIARVDELQFDLGQGPCWDALELGSPVLEPDVLRAPRGVWPEFASAVQHGPTAALFAFPMRIGPLRIGAIDVYDVRSRDLERQDVAALAEFAAVTGRRVLEHALRRAGNEDEPEAPHSRRVIHQATGFVIGQLGVSAEEAELLIRASAFTEGRPMREIAEELVDRRRRYTVDGSVIEVVS
jgi:GAF domain-containing protein